MAYYNYGLCLAAAPGAALPGEKDGTPRRARDAKLCHKKPYTLY